MAETEQKLMKSEKHKESELQAVQILYDQAKDRLKSNQEQKLQSGYCSSRATRSCWKEDGTCDGTNQNVLK